MFGPSLFVVAGALIRLLLMGAFNSFFFLCCHCGVASAVLKWYLPSCKQSEEFPLFILSNDPSGNMAPLLADH